MLELLNNTTHKAGLTVTAMKDINTYKTGKKISDEEMATINIERDTFHGDWKYTINLKLNPKCYFGKPPYLSNNRV